MNLQFDAQTVESLDQKIKAYSKNSPIAPPAFLEAELRRIVHWDRIRFSGLKPGFLFDDFFENYKTTLEIEYQCYFEPEKFLETLRPVYWWQFTYAGCNAQIEEFLMENGFNEALETIWDVIEKSPTRTIPNSALPNPIRRYLIGIGYLFPQKDSVIVHHNMLFGQLATGTTYATMDSPFLTRDIIRCPYHETKDDNGWSSPPLSDRELWDYWKDLLALSIAGLPEYTLYRPEQFRKEEPLSPEQQEKLNLGRKLVPQRYVALEPKIETFEWQFRNV